MQIKPLKVCVNLVSDKRRKEEKYTSEWEQEQTLVDFWSFFLAWTFEDSHSKQQVQTRNHSSGVL